LSSNDELSGKRSGGALALTISYHGGAFFGSQRQGERRTVQRELERALHELYGTETPSVFAGRTDRGVHAAAQVVSVVDRRPDLMESQIQKALNVRLTRDLAVVKVERRPSEFHARYDARWREYRYHLWSGTRQPFVETQVALTIGRLNVEAMAEAARSLVGANDLASFAGDGEGLPGSVRSEAPRGSVRTVSHCSARRIAPWWTSETGSGELFEFRVVADGFLPKMVRNIVGGLIEVGSGRRDPHWFEELLTGRDRRLAGMTAPAHGLILWRVGYDGERPEDDTPEPNTGMTTF